MPKGFICYRHDDSAVYGVGPTAERALDDARSALHDAAWEQIDEEIEGLKQGLPASEIDIFPASEALVSAVEYRGGDLAWIVHDGVAILPEEKPKEPT